ncbi:F-box/FBD/LRR-repeat protein At1g13570-like [Ipomoea triloba]|uniref:F-box/FBD/LRR-repeat protein At1g13570-like n=1 Tax=Ipomoea triloba TaxID=35885 RepID=UPI00125D79DC|nr:F-box/FBD/LRR-repeat protein At1g13570-like [Ipomoea triloba]
MARCHQHSRTIRELPANVKDRILECLPTRDAARTALLSKHWHNVWLGHGRLVFDSDFFQFLGKSEDDDKSISFVNIIHNVLLLRTGRVKKFTLEINKAQDHMPQQSDLDLWCSFLSRNGVEELNISFFGLDEHLYKLPDCIVSCQTIKQLKLQGFLIDLPVNIGCIFAGVTSLALENLNFKPSVYGIGSSVISIPNLEKLAFRFCYGIESFEISAPKLETFYAISIKHAELAVVEYRCFRLHLKGIKTLCLSGVLLLCKDVAGALYMYPIAINLQVMKLHDLSFGCGKQLTVAMQLLQKFPNLCELDIIAKQSSSTDDKHAASRLLNDPDRCFINKDLRMLKTVKIVSFSGSELEILFVKMLLSKSPSLENVVIQETEKIKSSMKTLRKLLSFPRASPKAQLVCMKYKSSANSLVDYLNF